ncbi:MAG: hypothetical protein H0X30_15905 [Anaerolineae bacterium]|nr:hypothetical protein [Anaerolineae bacterium]
MSNQLALLTQNELAELSYSELNQAILLAYFLLQEQKRAGKPTDDYEQVYNAYTTEQNKRLESI